MTSKKCSRCNRKKTLEKFPKNKDGKYGRGSICKKCYNEHYHKNKKEILRKRKREYLKNKERLNRQKRLKYKEDKNHRNKILQECRKSYIKNRDRRLSYAKKYQSEDKNKKRRNKKQKERLKTDLQFKLSTYIRNRIGFFFKKQIMPNSSIKALRCSVKTLVSHLESLFESGMNWKNYGAGPGKWEIDHILPLCSFDLKKASQFNRACHYTNLQPLWHEDHVEKTIKDFALSRKKIK